MWYLSDRAANALSSYHFQPDYCKNQANIAANTLSCRPPRKTFGALRFWALSSKLDSHFFKSHVFELHIFKPHSYAFKSYISTYCFHAFKHYVFKPYVFESLLRPHFFAPLFISFLHFFNPDLTISDLYLWNICFVLATSVVWCVSK